MADLKPAENPRLKDTDVFCKTPKCRGVLFDETSRLGYGLGVVTLQCREYGRGQSCGGRWAVRTAEAVARG